MGSTKRRVKKIFTPNNMYRVLKTYSGDDIFVYRHAFDPEGTENHARTCELLGEGDTNELKYEIRGEHIDSFSTRDWTLREVVAHIEQNPRLYL